MGRGRGDAGGRADPLLTVSEVAAQLRVSNMTVYRLIKGGQLAAIRVGKNYRIRQQALDTYLEAGSLPVSSATTPTTPAEQQ